VGPVRYLAIVAIQRDDNTIRDFNIDRALELVTLKLVGFAEVVHVLLDRLSPDSSIVLFGGQAKDRPYPGSARCRPWRRDRAGLAHAWGLATIRVGTITGDRRRQPTGTAAARGTRDTRREAITKKLATMDDIVAGTRFLLENPSVDGIDLVVDNGRLMF
jgi:hypothetical protein